MKIDNVYNKKVWKSVKVRPEKLNKDKSLKRASQSVEMKDALKANNIPSIESNFYIKLVSQVHKALDKRKLNVDDWRIGYMEGSVKNFQIEFELDCNRVLLDGRLLENVA
jgi:hypothetical protein